MDQKIYSNFNNYVQRRLQDEKKIKRAQIEKKQMQQSSRSKHDEKFNRIREAQEKLAKDHEKKKKEIVTKAREHEKAAE